MVCCETYKFCERAQLDSICFNDKTTVGKPSSGHGHGDDKAKANGFGSGRPAGLGDGVEVLQLAYDITPAAAVTAVVTEVGMIPPSSVPVIIREYHQQARE